MSKLGLGSIVLSSVTTVAMLAASAPAAAVQASFSGQVNRAVLWADNGRKSDVLNVDNSGFDHMDRRMLLTMIEKFGGGPVGVESLAAAISEERDTIEDVLEPYLIQQGFIMRTPRGRVATDHAYRHFGIDKPDMDQ